MMKSKKGLMLSKRRRYITMNLRKRKYTRPLSTNVRVIGLILGLVIHTLFIILYKELYESMTLLVFSLSLFFPLFFVYIYSKLIFATLYRKEELDNPEIDDKIQQATVSLVVPFYNENLKLMKQQVRTILDQRKPFTHVYFIDDGSDTKEVSNFLQEICDQFPNFHLYICDKNGGKRNAQGKVLSLIDTDFIMTTDSDTQLLEDCLYELLIPFFKKSKKREVVSVTGKVLASNESENLLTKTLNSRYFNAFEAERAAQSVTRSVIVASGPCTIYKSKIIQDNLDEYLNQIFLGKKQTFGDDRCLTNIALRYGEVLYQSSAVALTHIPSTFKGFIRQQIRWNRSFFRESFLGLRSMSKARHIKPLLWIVLELIMFVLLLVTLALAIYSIFFQSGYLLLETLLFALFVIVNSLVRNIYYFTITPMTFLIAPLYGFLHLLVITPIKIYALFTLKDNRWITR